MDFEDSGIESDPKVNSDIDTFNQNEPIISFSPERCRFDSGQPSSRKSSTSFPISVADLQLDDPSVSALYQSSSNAKNCNSIANLQNTSVTTAVPRNLSIHLNHNSLTQNDQHQQHQQPHPQPLFQKQAFPFLHQQHQSSISTFPTSSIVPGAVINTHSTATLNSTGTTSGGSSNISSNTNNTASPLFLSKSSAAPDCNSIPLMVNGAGVSISNSTTTTTLDLQKRLEKHIAQATAPIAVAPTSTSTTTSSSFSATKSNSVELKHQNDSIISDIPCSISGIASSQGGNGNQISFSPPKPSCSAATHVFQPKLSSSSLWESDSSIDLWESKIAPKTGGSSRIGDDFDLEDEKPSLSATVMEGLLLDSPSHQVQVDSIATTTTVVADASHVKNDNEYSSNNSSEIAKLVLTTSATTINTSSSNETSNNVNKSGKTGMGKTRSNQSLRNNATNPSNVPAAAAGTTTTNSTSSASTSSASAFISSTPSVITVVNSGFDIRKVSALLPPQRLAIPTKPNPQLQSSHLTNNSKTTGITTSLSASGGLPTTTTGSSNNCTGTTVTFPGSPFSSSNPCTTTTSVYGSSSLSTAVHKTSNSKTASISETSCNNSSSNSVPPSGNGNVIKAGSNSNSSKLSSEKKPLVQWDSDESEEELSFFPSSKRGVITDNLSIDNMSLSGEEEDLHLTPPRPLTKRCPCDPRSWLERHDISNHHHGDSTHSISRRSCVIS